MTEETKRLTLRVVGYDEKGAIDQILEQEIPATAHDVEIALRRWHFRTAVSHALMKGGRIVIEKRKA